MSTFTTPAPISAVVAIPAGRIHLVAADRADTTVEIVPADASKSRDVKVAEQTTVEYRDGVLRVEASPKNQYFGPSGTVDVTVHLPAGSRVEYKFIKRDGSGNAVWESGTNRVVSVGSGEMELTDAWK